MVAPARSKSRRRAPKRILAFAAIITVAIVAILIKQKGSSQPHRIPVAEGDYRIVEILDWNLFKVKIESAAIKTAQVFDGEFELRLAEIKLPSEQNESSKSTNLQFVNSRLNIGQIVYVRFDRHRYEHDGTVVGYIFVGDAMLNLELVEKGLAIPNPVAGNSVAIQNRMRKAHNQYSGKE